MIRPEGFLYFHFTGRDQNRELGGSTIAKWDFSDDHSCPVEHHSQQHDGELWRSSASNHADLQRLREWRHAGECGYGRKCPGDREALELCVCGNDVSAHVVPA